jgi:putative transposase
MREGGVKRAFKYRFYPTVQPADLLNRTFGCVRKVYNLALAERSRVYVAESRSMSYVQTSAALTEWKKTDELAFLNEVSSVPLQQTLRHLQDAYAAFFDKRAKYPRFKSKHKSRASAEYTKSGFRWHDGQLTLAKMAEPLTIVWSRPLPEDVERVDRIKLAKAQRRLAKKQKNSANRAKARIKVARVHARIGDRRRDLLHKLSTRLIRENQTVAIEDLAVRNMIKNHSLARSISDASWRELRSMLEYKAQWYGRTVVAVDRWFPSSRMCSTCGVLAESLPLNIREWTCRCGVTHDRDHNAAINILAAGLAES